MNGWFRIGTAWGAPIEVHFSLPLMLAAMSGFRLAPVFWALAALLILVHELGHAVAARSMRLHVHRIALHGLGGHIETEYPGGLAASARLASGGVLAQLAVLAVVLPFAVLDDRKDAAWVQVQDTLLNWNVAVILLNLLPVAPLDGHRIWPWVRAKVAAWWATGSPDAKKRRRGGPPRLH